MLAGLRAAFAMPPAVRTWAPTLPERDGYPMKRASWLPLFLLLLLVPAVALAEFDPAAYKESTQADLVKRPEANAGKKFKVVDVFNFCGSDFCVQVLKTKINTKEYYCFTLGSLCLVRMYLKKDHPDAEALSKARKGDRITVYGTFDYIGTDYRYLIADHVVVEKGR